MSGPVEQRPRLVTMAGWLVIGGSVLMVVTIFDSMTRLYSLEMRTSIETFLNKPPGDELGLTVDGVRSLLRGLMLVGGAVGAAAAILGWHVLRGHSAARVALAVLAVPIFLTAPVSGGLVGFVVAGASLLLWSRPARDWFAGREPQADPARKAGITMTEQPPGEDGSQGAQGSPGPTGGQRPTQPPAYPQPYGGYPGAQQPGYPPDPRAPQGYPQQPPPGQYAGYPPPYAPQWAQMPAPGERRPTTVTAACWLTWVLSGLTAVVYVFVMIVLAVAREDLLSRIHDEPAFRNLNIDDDQLMAVLWVMCVIFLIWSLVALLLAFFAFRRSNAARITLVVSSGVASLVSLAAFPLGLFHLLVLVATIVLLFTGGANEWFRGRGHGGSGYPGGGGPYPHQPGQRYPGQPDQQYPGQPGQERSRQGEGRPPVW